MDQSQDGQLVLRLQDGDLEALGSLFDRHRQMVYRTALAITGDPEIAADLLQDVFLRLHRFAHRIDPQRPLKPWLYRVTVNISYTYLRYLRRRRWLPVPIEDLLQQVGTSKASLERQVEQREAREVVFSALTRLPPTQRVVVVLYYLNNLSLKDIAEILKCPVGTIKSRLFYSRENLRKILEGDEHATFDLAYDIR